jgi:hypothetical protein
MAGRALEPLSWNEKALRLLLRLSAAVLFLAVLAIFLPVSWMAAAHAWLGLGDFPDTPLVGYLTRSVSAFYAFHGAILFQLSQDVRRYGPVIRLVAVGSVVFGACLLIVDVMVGMPLFWVLGEGPAVMATGAAFLWLQRGGPPAGG